MRHHLVRFYQSLLSFSSSFQTPTSLTTRRCLMLLSWWRGNHFMHIKFCCLQLHRGKEELCCSLVILSVFCRVPIICPGLLLFHPGSSPCSRTDQQQRTPVLRSATSNTIFSMQEFYCFIFCFPIMTQTHCHYVVVS